MRFDRQKHKQSIFLLLPADCCISIVVCIVAIAKALQDDAACWPLSTISQKGAKYYTTKGIVVICLGFDKILNFIINLPLSLSQNV